MKRGSKPRHGLRILRLARMNGVGKRRISLDGCAAVRRRCLMARDTVESEWAIPESVRPGVRHDAAIRTEGL